MRLRHLRVVLALLNKELRIEIRTKEITTTTALFALLLTVMASLSLYVERGAARLVGPGVLWLTLAFSGILATGRSWAREREEQVFLSYLLAPVPPCCFFFAKLLSLLLFTGAIAVLLIPLIGLLFHLDWSIHLGTLCAVTGLGLLGFVSVATLFGSMTVRTQGRDLMLSIVVFPLVAPALLSSVVATRELLAGAPTSEIVGWIWLLAAFDIFALAGGAMLFGLLALDSRD